jgi:hypothetical protein
MSANLPNRRGYQHEVDGAAQSFSRMGIEWIVQAATVCLGLPDHYSRCVVSLIVGVLHTVLHVIFRLNWFRSNQ